MSSFSYAKTSVSLEMRYPNPLVFKPHFSLPKNWHLANPPCRCRPIQGSKSRMYERGMERTGFTLQPVDNGDGQGMTSQAFDNFNWAYDDQQKMWAKAWKLDLRHSWRQEESQAASESIPLNSMDLHGLSWFVKMAIGGFDQETACMSNVAEGHHTVSGRATTPRVGGIVAESLTLASAARLVMTRNQCIQDIVFEFSVLQCIDV